MESGIEVRRGTIRWPNEEGGTTNAVYREVEQAAWQAAGLAVNPGEQVVSVEVHGGSAETGNDRVMVWRYSYHVLKPGGATTAT